MKLTVLTDNHTYIDQYYLGEPAFSCWLEADGKRVLFDTGYSGVFLKMPTPWASRRRRRTSWCCPTGTTTTPAGCGPSAAPWERTVRR